MAAPVLVPAAGRQPGLAGGGRSAGTGQRAAAMTRLDTRQPGAGSCLPSTLAMYIAEREANWLHFNLACLCQNCNPPVWLDGPPSPAVVPALLGHACWVCITAGMRTRISAADECGAPATTQAAFERFAVRAGAAAAAAAGRRRCCRWAATAPLAGCLQHDRPASHSDGLGWA